MSKKVGKILASFLLIILVFGIINSVYAEINEEYYNNNLGAFEVNDTKENVIKKTLASILLEAIGDLVYALASLGEWLLGYIFQAAAGGDSANNIFPWADAIVFNAIPALDVNFLNPHSAGTVIQKLQDVLKVIYGTIFGIALSFFSIAVLIMGIKIAISTIASEKAKYKQGLLDWLLGLLLLFTMHIFISFVFYLNETLVEKASSIASTHISDMNSYLDVRFSSADNKERMIQFVASQYSFTIGYNTYDLIQAFFNSLGGEDSVKRKQAEFLIREDNIAIGVALLQNQDFVDAGLGGFWANDNPDAWWNLGNADPDRVAFLIDVIKLLKQWRENGVDVATVVQNQIDYVENDASWSVSGYRLNLLGEVEGHDVSKHLRYGLFDKAGSAKKLCNSLKAVYATTGFGNSNISVLSNLAQYFKQAAWTRADGSWKNDKVVIQNAIMYAILVVQSFIFLISYVKRLFYVLILAMMAPVVVVYDFFNKTIS